VSKDPRIDRILDHIMALASGHLDARLDASDARDELDAIITGLNLLAEELAHSAEERRTLRGLLPVCAFCRKVRDDHGTWVSIETFIQERSQAQFSHGYCETCVREHYGYLFDGGGEE
jgi:hypothetical protein